ncbi:hypothetical protein M404DRAFT_35474 [Pisolithus tinctorius Marx 270]|uniref:Uncharacterized protein n=1 Tax=Pisolithus tinctorius Marx 270 TaxID=870435 RepID=A0A0C3NE19_PISTI|nr:hypothetical protein M404DRAFT_35474 [Pisolithus tinctorius Marx 270]
MYNSQKAPVSKPWTIIPILRGLTGIIIVLALIVLGGRLPIARTSIELGAWTMDHLFVPRWPNVFTIDLSCLFHVKPASAVPYSGEGDIDMLRDIAQQISEVKQIIGDVQARHSATGTASTSGSDGVITGSRRRLEHWKEDYAGESVIYL